MTIIDDKTNSCKLRLELQEFNKWRVQDTADGVRRCDRKRETHRKTFNNWINIYTRMTRCEILWKYWNRDISRNWKHLTFTVTRIVTRREVKRGGFDSIHRIYQYQHYTDNFYQYQHYTDNFLDGRTRRMDGCTQRT